VNRATYQAPWAQRSGANAVVFNGKLWLLGGGNSQNNPEIIYPEITTNEVWWTADGQTWHQNPSAPFSSSQGPPVVADGKLWIVAASTNPPSNQLWYTTDGESWTLANSQLPFSPRWRVYAAAFNNKLWVIGGQVATGTAIAYLDDAWYMDLPTEGVSVASGHAPWYQAGEAMDLTAATAGLDGPLTYQWYRDGQAVTDATGAAYHVDQAGPDDAGSYICLVADQSNSTYTAGPVSIMVLPPGMRLPLMPIIAVLLIIVSAATGVRAINSRRA